MTNRIDMEEITNRVDELRSEREELQSAIEEAGDSQEASMPEPEQEARMNFACWEEDNAEELAELEELLEELRGAGGGDHQWEGDWYPRELIADYDFEDYARELAEDIGAVKADAGWPNNCIDWKQAARELAMDYSMVTFRGTDYYWR